MNRSALFGVCAAAALQLAAPAFAADTPHPKGFRPQILPQLYVSSDKAQTACPDDHVVWVNWSARTSHLPDSKWYGHTVTGAYACSAAAVAAGIKQAA